MYGVFYSGLLIDKMGHNNHQAPCATNVRLLYVFLMRLKPRCHKSKLTELKTSNVHFNLDATHVPVFNHRSVNIGYKLS